MLESLLLRNFQVHRKLLLEFDPHVTTILGPSDAGKSAIVRALRWVFLNQPRGDSFTRHGAGTVKVTCGIDGSQVTRKAGKGNEYQLDGKIFRSFGSAVPDEIRLHHQLSPTNFQGQFDSPFWFAQSPGEVSRALNQIINLGVIDTSLSNISSEVRRAKVETEVIQERLTGAIAKKQELSDVPRMDEELKELESKYARLCDLRTTAAGLAVLVTKVSRVQTTKGRAIHYRTACEDLLRTGSDLLKTQEKSNSLKKLLSDIKRTRKASALDISKLDEQCSWIVAIQRRKQRLADLISSVGVKSRESKSTAIQLSETEFDLKSIKKRMKVCPVCNKPMK